MKINIEDKFFEGGKVIENCYLALDPEEKEVRIEEWVEPNSTPGYIERGREYWYELEEGTTKEEIVSLVQKYESLIEKLFAGYSCEWDGHNWQGQLNNSALNALNSLDFQLGLYRYGPFMG